MRIFKDNNPGIDGIILSLPSQSRLNLHIHQPYFHHVLLYIFPSVLYLEQN